MRRETRWLVTTLGVVLLALAAALGAVPAVAQVVNRDSVVITRLPQPANQRLQAWLRNRDDGSGSPPPIAFKVPASTLTNVICRLNPEGLHCYESLVGAICPSTVTVQIPGGGETTVPINCSGPDSEGNCECDFAGR